MRKFTLILSFLILSTLTFILLNCTNPEEPPTPTPISVVTPNSNTVWHYYDTDLAINWTGYNSSYIDIDLYHSDTLFLQIADGIENDGGYIFNGPIPATWPQDTTYHVRLLDGSGTAGTSDYFTVSECTGSEVVTVTQPMAGDEWQHYESGYMVAWDYPGSGKNSTGSISIIGGKPLAGETVDIELWNDDEKVVEIAEGIPNDGNWTLTDPVSPFWGIDSTYQIKVMDDLGNFGYSSEFSLIPCDDPEVIDVTEPASGTIMEHYETNTQVKWEYQGDLEGDSITIDLYNDTTFVSEFSDGWVANSGTYTRTESINPRWEASDTYRLRVYDNQYCYGWSEEFEITVAEMIDISDPSSSTEWMHYSEDNSVTWDANVLESDSVEIALYKDSTLVETLTDYAENTGEWTFAGPVPEEWTVGSDYQIYIIDEYGDYGWSEDFTVSLSSGADVIAVTEPDSMTSWIHFQTGYSIEWYYNGQFMRAGSTLYNIASRGGYEPLSGDSVRIELLKSGAFVAYLSDWVENTGDYEITMLVSGDWDAGSDYKVRVQDNQDNYGMSEYFEIVNCSGQEIITVSTPADTTVWKHYETGAEVIWQYPAVLSGDSIKIEVYDDEGVTYVADFTDDWIPNTGSFTRSKIIAPAWGVGDEFRIKVIDELDNYGWSAGFEIEPDDVIDITMPTSGTQWMQYSADNLIRWDTTGVLSDSVTISVYKDSVYVQTLTDTALNTGEWTYSGPVPGSWTVGSDYQIYIIDEYGDYGWSAEFEVATASGQNVITVTAPDSNTVWEHFATGYPIEWEYSSMVATAGGIFNSLLFRTSPLAGDSVRIELLDNGVHADWLTGWIPNTGVYELTELVSMSWGTGNKFQVKVTDNTANYGTSEEFEIREATHQEVITITAPTAETAWEHYEKNTEVTWEYPAVCSGDSVKIELYDGATFIADYSDGWILNDGSYTRTTIIDPAWGAGKHFQVKVFDEFLNYGYSEDFKLNNAEIIDVNLPDSSTVWMHTSSFQTIRWDTTGIQSHDMNISIYKDTVLVETLVTGTGNDGEWIYAGPVPETWTPGEDYYINITDNYSDYGYSADFHVISTYPGSVTSTVNVDDAPWELCSLPNGDYVYVPCSADSSVFVIDTHGNIVDDSISVGASPVECCTRTQGDYVYVSDAIGDSIYVIRTANNSVYDVINVEAPSSGLCTEPNGDFLYAAIPSENKIEVIRLPQNSIIATITMGGAPNRICTVPSGKYLYVTIASSNIVSVIDTETNTVIENINIGYVPDDICVLPSGEFVFVTTMGASTPVIVIRTSDNTVVQEIQIEEDNAICAMSSGDYVYITQETLGTVKVIRTWDYEVVDTIIVGLGPAGICVLPSDEYLYVANKGERTISIIE